MTFPGCFVILNLFRLLVCMRSDDIPILKPFTSDVSKYPQMARSTGICFINNKPIDCLKIDSGTVYNPFAISPDSKKSRNYHLDSTPTNPPLTHPRSLTTHTLKGRLDNVLRWPLFYRNPQTYPQPYIHYSTNLEIQGNLYNSPLFEHGKRHYEKTTVANTIKHSSDGSLLPSRDNVVDGSESATEILFSSVFKPDQDNVTSVNVTLFDKFTRSLDSFERKFYQTTFNKLLSMSPLSRLDNGISFVQSGLFLYMALMALSTEVDSASSFEIDSNLLQTSVAEKISILREVATWLPRSSHDLKFRWATRLVLEQGLPVTQEFMEDTASALKLHVEWLNGTETVDTLTRVLNSRVKADSGGAMRNTFEEGDFSEGACSVLLNTMYIRARWRSPPTVLNGSRPFRDTEHASDRSVRMIRINDMMRYAFLDEWRAEALEIRYATPDLTLLLLVPQGHTLKNLATNMATTSLRKIDEKMLTMRIAAILPIYTLRMTLLLPGKLQEMGISNLVDTKNRTSSGCGELRLSHGVQRLMFWAEAGRNAFKDDGIEWDEAPEKEMIMDRPYLFYVRWKNVTLMNGNFVL